MTGPDRVALFRDDIAASADALADLLDRWRPTDLGAARRLVAFGLGSSRSAALVATAAARARGASAWAEHASAHVPPPPASDLVALCVSASGRTPEVVELADRHRGRSRVVAVTNDPGSPLALAADIVVPLHAGEERSGIASRTYRATLVVLGLLLGVVDRSTVAGWLPAITTAAAGDDGWIEEATDALDGAPSVDVVADVGLLGAAEQAALMLREAPRLPAHAVATPEWPHTQVYLALPGHRVLRFPGSATDDEVATIVGRRGGRVTDVPGMTGDALRDAVVAGIGVERLAARLWDRARATGGDMQAPLPLGDRVD